MHVKSSWNYILEDILYMMTGFEGKSLPNGFLSVDNKGVGLCNEAVPVQVRPKGGWESKCR